MMLSVKQESTGMKYPQHFPLAIDIATQNLDVAAWEMAFVQGHWVLFLLTPLKAFSVPNRILKNGEMHP